MNGNRLTYRGITSIVKYSNENNCYVGKINYNNKIIEFIGHDEESLIRNFIYTVNDLD